jgi:hypothetical protein
MLPGIPDVFEPEGAETVTVEEGEPDKGETVSSQEIKFDAKIVVERT